MGKFVVYILVLSNNEWRTIVAPSDKELALKDTVTHVVMTDVPDEASAKGAKQLFDTFFVRFLEERPAYCGVVQNAAQPAITAFRTVVQTAH